MAAEPTPLEVAQQMVELARKAGAEQCDAFVRVYDESNVSVRMGEVERLIEAGSHAIGLRVINGGRTATCSTSDFRDDSLRELARQAVELANISEPDEFAGLPDPSLFARANADGLQLFDERLQSLSVEEKKAMVLACERAAFATDSRINNSDGASFSSHSGHVALANSLGFAGDYASTGVSIAVEVMADDADGKKRNASWFSSERMLHRLLDPAEIGRIAAHRAIAQLGARKVETRSVPIVFEPLMAARLAGTVAGCATGSGLYRGATFLASRKGDRIGSEFVTLIDNPLDPGRAGSRPFDGEGVSVAPLHIFDGGVFQAFLFDVYTGRATSNPTTGSAHRGVESLPSPGASNLVWQPGAVSPEEIIAGVQDGLYVTSLMGFGFNPSTGDFSRGVAGFWISGGEIAFPVTEVNISGRMDDMLASVDAVGSDLTWFGAVAAPTVRLSSMMVSGL